MSSDLLQLKEKLQAEYHARWEAAGRRADAREFALTRRVLLMRAASGVDVDVALGAFPFEERNVERSSTWTWADNQSLITCSAEDLVVHKAFAGRDLE